MQGDLPHLIEDQVRATVYSLPTRGVKAFEAKAEVPHQKALRTLDDALAHDEVRGVEGVEHMGKDVLNGVQALHIVKRILETSVGCIQFRQAW